MYNTSVSLTTKFVRHKIMSKNFGYYNTSHQAFLYIIFEATRWAQFTSIIFLPMLKISPLRRHRLTPLLSLPVWRWGYHYLLGLPQGSWTGSLRALQTVDLNLLSVRTKHNKRYCKWKISTMTFFAKLSIRQEVCYYFPPCWQTTTLAIWPLSLV